MKVGFKLWHVFELLLLFSPILSLFSFFKSPKLQNWKLLRTSFSTPVSHLSCQGKTSTVRSVTHFTFPASATYIFLENKVKLIFRMSSDRNTGWQDEEKSATCRTKALKQKFISIKSHGWRHGSTHCLTNSRSKCGSAAMELQLLCQSWRFCTAKSVLPHQPVNRTV